MAKRRLKKSAKRKLKILGAKIALVVLVFILLLSLYNYFLFKRTLKPVSNEKEYYNISDFGFVRYTSISDYNKNGVDDITDILNGAKKFAEFNPKYVDKYYKGGYPEVEKEGVCTDLIWYALKNAGYNLKDMIDKDIDTTYGKGYYPSVGKVDTNIDFRRVSNQENFLKRYAIKLENDMYDIGSFMPGDILVFDDQSHIAMVSDKYNKNGVPFLIQNRDETQKEKEEDRLEETDMKVTGHYRFEYNDKIKTLLNT